MEDINFGLKKYFFVLLRVKVYKKIHEIRGTYIVKKNCIDYAKSPVI